MKTTSSRLSSSPARWAVGGSTRACRGDLPAALIRWFRFGDGFLELDSDEPEFGERFEALYRECRTAAPAGRELPRVRCAVRLTDAARGVRVSFDDPEPLGQVPFAVARDSSGPEPADDPAWPWRDIRAARDAGRLTFEGEALVAERSCPWPTVAAALALHRVLRLQRATFFFHAASVAVSGRGALLMGPKAAGKTTLSLALAEQGHAFFGDEIAALRRDSLELLPFRKRLSIRPGPASPGVARKLAGHSFETVQVGDGSSRTLADPLGLFPAPPPSAPLRAIFFLDARTAHGNATLLRPTIADVGRLAPFESMMWGRSAGVVALGLLQLLGRVPCYGLEPGEIAETVTLIESLLEEA